MKKWLVLLLALVMVFSLAACGSDEGSESADDSANVSEEDAAQDAENASDAQSKVTPEDGASLVVWESKDQYGYMSQIAKDFTELYNIPVKVVKTEITEQVDKLAQITDDKAPDVVVFPHDHLGRAVAGKLVLENTDFAETTKASSPESAINAVSADGKLYGYPKSVEAVALIYNKDLIPTPPATWDEVLAYASNKDIHDPANKKYAILWEVAGAYHSYAFVGSNGGYVFGNNGTNATDLGVNNEGAVKGLTTYAQVKKDLLSSMKSGDANGGVINELFMTEKVAMTINGPWAVKDYQDAGINIGVAKIPAFGSEPAKPFGGVRAYYVSSKSKYPKAAALFSNYATGKVAQIKLYNFKKAVPANTEAASEAVIQEDPVVSGFAAQFADATPMPSIPEMGTYWGAVGGALAEIWDKGADPKAAADKAAKSMTDAIAATKK
jgi:arabinogalactan oligomer/maltooligosaccharide transport system substrate-binding protein